MSYYEKWAAASAAIAIERGTISRQELEDVQGRDPATLDTSIRRVPGGSCAGAAASRPHAKQRALAAPKRMRSHACMLQPQPAPRTAASARPQQRVALHDGRAAGSVRATWCASSARTRRCAGAGRTCARQATSSARSAAVWRVQAGSGTGVADAHVCGVNGCLCGCGPGE